MPLRVPWRRAYRLHPRWGSVDELLDHYRGPGGDVAVDLGCGYYAPPEFIGVDDLRGVGSQVPDDENAPDIYTNLDTSPVPLPDDCCIELRASHFLEHAQLDHVFGEVHRLLRPGGVFQFAVPYANSPEGMFPGHSIFLTERFFYENMFFQERFEITDEEYDASPLWDQVPAGVKEQLPFDLARQLFYGVCRQMTMRAAVRK